FNGAGSSWTGFYAGPVVGYGANLSKTDAARLSPNTGAANVIAGMGAVPASIPVSAGGVTAGLTVGYN
ncbi:hypothetical protein, partial [Escherichia coli]|uniref:hypothetical protein n=1 Tax=Escherichia coli TaxID=562 RepID=UPI0019533070